jgi:hypothetical protein
MAEKGRVRVFLHTWEQILTDLLLMTMNVIPSVDDRLLKSLLKNPRYWCDKCSKTFATKKEHNFHQKLNHNYMT